MQTVPEKKMSMPPDSRMTEQEWIWIENYENKQESLIQIPTSNIVL